MLLPSLFILCAGIFTGTLLGLLGSGGSILALPAFVYVAHIPVKSAVATSLVVVGVTSLVGAILAQRRCSVHGCPGQEVDPKITLIFAFGGLFGAFGGAKLSQYIPASVQLILFACVMLGSAVGMLRRKVETNSQAPSTARALPFNATLALGASIGLLTGVVGVGGGFLIVPALSLAAKLPIKRAMNMSLWVIAVNSLTGTLGYVGRVAIHWDVAGFFLIGSVLGMMAGQVWGRTLSPRRLQVAFACLLVAIGSFTLIQNLMKHTA